MIALVAFAFAGANHHRPLSACYFVRTTVTEGTHRVFLGTFKVQIITVLPRADIGGCFGSGFARFARNSIFVGRVQLEVFTHHIICVGPITGHKHVRVELLEIAKTAVINVLVTSLALGAVPVYNTVGTFMVSIVETWCTNIFGHLAIHTADVGQAFEHLDPSCQHAEGFSLGRGYTTWSV